MPRPNQPRLCLALVLLFLASARLSAADWELAIPQQSFTTKVFTVDAGLPANVVQALVQTRDGYIWAGTESGLGRFDGVHFTAYRVSEYPELCDNLIRCLHEDRTGRLWIGTQRGLASYENGRFRRWSEISRPVGAITEHPDGSVWFGTQHAGLWKFQDGVLSQIEDTPLLKRSDSPLRIFASSTGQVWAGIDRGRLVYLDAKGIHLADPQLGTMQQSNRFLETADGSLWIAARHELFRWRGDKLTKIAGEFSAKEEPITGLTEDREGRIWVCAGMGLWVAEKAEEISFVRVPVPAIEFPRTLMQDREGTYWIASSGDGIARIRPTSFRLVTTDHVPLRRARSVAFDAAGSAWAAFGSETHGLARMAPDGRIDFMSIGIGADADVQCVQAGTNGDMWLGTRGSLALWRKGVVHRFPEHRNVRVIFKAQDGTMWFGPVGRGVVCHRDGQFVAVNLPEAFKKLSVSAIADGPDSGVYVGFLSDGILRFDRQGTMAVNVDDGIPSQEVRAIHFDAEQRMWVGFRRKGLAVFVDGAWRNPKDLIHPFGERVTGIAEDGFGNFWLGTARGIIWGKKSDFLAVVNGARWDGRFRVAGVAEGIGGGAVGIGTQPAMAKAADGALWFATREGVVAVRPGSVPLNTVPPPVMIESVTVDGKIAVPRGELRLPAGVRSLSIDYTALAFVQPERVLFRYQLVGHDADWVHAGTRRTAFFTSLAPGRYVFKVRACNEDGIWNETGASLTIVQAPWIYQTWWFYVLVAGVVTAGGLGAYAWRTAALRRLVAMQTARIRNQMEKEAQLRSELERKARLESLGVLAGGIAHDFNNLLTVIIANVELASLNEQVRAKAGGYLEAAGRGAHRAAELTQQLLTFAKGGDPVCRAVALPDVVREAAEFARHGTQVRCDIVIEPELPQVSADRAQISRVVHNLVLNATQAMPNGGIIRVSLSTVDAASGEPLAPGRYVRLSISDEGCGIQPEHLPHVFDPYFSTKPKNHGLGLATVHSIVRRHHGQVTVESEVGKGTTFHIWLPVAKELTPAEPAPGAAHVVRKTPKARVLFMDDEETIRTVADGILRHLGHDAVVVPDGSDAVREFEIAKKAGRPFDLVVLDLTVPGGMGGRPAIEALRKIDPGVRAIVSSGYSSDPVLANFKEFGFCCVVPKPYKFEELAAAIQRVMEEKQPAPTS